MEDNFNKEISNKLCTRFGVIAVNKGFVTLDQLKEGLTEQAEDNISERPHRLIGRIFFEKGLITAEQIDLVLNELERLS